MLKIGDFSKLSRVSIRMLRHYDEIDLLKPIKIDEFTGYRYYSEEQLLVMARINALKDMGFSLAVIREILRCYNNKEANGYAYCGPMFNIYHVSPHETKNPEEFVTEACCPIQKK